MIARRAAGSSIAGWLTATRATGNGPWAALQNLGNATTFDTQPTYVLPIHGSKTTTYVYAGDRWQDPDLASSKYIWLPLGVRDDGTLTLDYHPEWQLDLESGEWSADDGFIPQDDWSLLGAFSEETSAENGRARNAFDGSASTIWHTQYTGGAPLPPHEIRIDLGASYQLEALRYLPRQDAVDHGMVADYQFFVSDDPMSWGSPVASGGMPAGRGPTTIAFATRTGRYVRFVATREISGGAWTSLAELDLRGTRR